MIDELRLLRGEDYVINQYIKIKQPTLDDIYKYGEQNYFVLVSMLCSTPSDMKVQLWDQFNIDWEQMNEFEFFSYLISNVGLKDSCILFGDLDFTKFKLAINNVNEEIVLHHKSKDIVIDNSIYLLITNYLRMVHNFDKKTDVAGNEHTKQYLLDKERRKIKRMQRKKSNYKPILAPLISSMVNCPNFKYDYKTVWNLPIYVFMDAVKRVQKINQYNQLMQGYYAGTVESKFLSEDKINWMGSLNES